jgi:glutamate--cysteine ligase
MPLARRTLTDAAAFELSAAMFAPSQPELFGLELEWLVHRRDDPSARPGPADIARLESHELPAGGRITFEPGGQVELSTAPVDSVVGAMQAAEIDAAALHSRMDAAGFVCRSVALDDRRPPHRVLQRPRYQAMERFFAEQGPAGAWMMCNTASTQVNVSHDENDQHQRWYTLHLIAPVLIGAFANSAGEDDNGRKWASLRQAVWLSIDPLRTRPVRTDLTPEVAWHDYALAADVMFINAEGSCGARGTAVRPGLPFVRWMTDGHETGWPTIEDYRYHLSTLFPPVRPRGWIELRVLDALPQWLREVAVLVVATACSAEAGSALRMRLPDTSGLWAMAACEGLGHPVLAEAARVLLEVTAEHLGSVTDDGHHAEMVEEYATRYVRRGRCPADDLASNAPSLHTPAALKLMPASTSA